jgi:hypothetical protein
LQNLFNIFPLAQVEFGPIPWPKPFSFLIFYSEMADQLSLAYLTFWRTSGPHPIFFQLRRAAAAAFGRHHHATLPALATALV